MKWLSIALFLLLPLCSFSQVENPYANGVGINLTQSPRSGLGISFRYRRQIGNKGIAKFELNSNVSNSYGGRIGYEPFELRWKRLELGLGLDVKYGFTDFSRFGQSKSSEWTLELPIELRFNISPEYSIYSGFSLSQLLSSSVCNICHQTISEIRLGLGYNF